jgi:LDH2 family malate/lactate/ureidoglycolate dehydrogenase
MATTVTARGKLRLAAARNEPIPAGIALNKDGEPTTDGMEAFHGVVLPFGGVKGAGIVMLIEILSGVLTGSDFAGKVTNMYTDFTKKQNVGHFILTIRPDIFMPIQSFKDRMDTLIDTVKAQPLAAGFSEILIAGEPEARSKALRIHAGLLPVQISTVQALTEVADELGVSFDVPVQS